MSLIEVNIIIIVTYFSKWNRLSLSLIAVNETPLMSEPYVPQKGHGSMKNAFVEQMEYHMTPLFRVR